MTKLIPEIIDCNVKFRSHDKMGKCNPRNPNGTSEFTTKGHERW